MGRYLGFYLGPCGKVNCCGLQPRSNDEDAEIIAQDEMLLFPNPAHNFLNIHLPISTTTPVQIQVYSSLGQVLNEYRTLEYRKSVISLNIESIPEGYYYLKVSSDLYKEIKPFVKLK